MDTTQESSGPVLASKLVISLAAVTVLAAILLRFTSVQKDPREPPFLYPSIPVVGHLLGLIRQGADYFHRLDNRYHQSLYTLPILGGRMYIASSNDWAQAIHKSHKSLQFNTLVAQAMKNLFLMDESAMETINQNLNNENGARDGIMMEIHDMMFSVLAPGQFLDDLNKSILDQILPDVNALAKHGPVQVKLWEWLRHHFAIASVTAIWGPQNPFLLRPEVEPAFWEFEASAMQLTMFPFSQFLARKGWKARELILSSLEEYTEKERYKDPGVSQLIKNRVKINMEKFGLSKKMYAYGDASLLFGALLNTIPTAFWLVSRIFEDPRLLSEIRGEVEDCITTMESDPKKRIINATKLRTSCPLFSAAFRETLRMVGSVNINRFVAEDVEVTNNTTGESYLLKKGSVVQIASNLIHSRPLWGPDPTTFNPRRFMSSGEKARSEAGSGKPPDPAAPFRDADGKVHSSAFRSFGGGNNICPGRHFAQTEILALTSLFVIGFDMENVGSSGSYKMPPYEDFKLMLGVIKPGKDVDVMLSRRKGYEETEWAFEM